MEDTILNAMSISNRILRIRGKAVMLDRDLALLYGVPTKALNQAVRRNITRFPGDFMLRLTAAEANQLVTNCDRFGTMKHSVSLPHAFTQEGVAMLSSVLNSEKAISINIQIMRAFVNLRRIGVTYESLKRKIEDMEKKYDGQFGIVFKTLRTLLEPPEKPKRRIGFRSL